MQALNLTDFPLKTFDKLRYGDTDRQGHINNAVFSTFLETGRVELLINADPPILSEGASFVIASLKLNFIKEMKWPGQVDIGTGIIRIGSSSITIYQKLFQNGVTVADAETVIVQVDDKQAKSKPLSDEAKATLNNWFIKKEEV